MKRHNWRDLEAWGERELIEYILDLEEQVESLEKIQEEEIDIPLSENDLQMLQEGGEHHWRFGRRDIHLYQEERTWSMILGE